jgi:5-methylcytosine-specific restriction endonuclease McrA
LGITQPPLSPMGDKTKLAALREAIGRKMVGGTPRKAMTPARKRRLHAQHNGLCTYCSQETEVMGPTVVYDHEIPLELGGADDDSNLGPIHASPCNKIKTAADIRQIAKMRRQEKMDDPKEPSRLQGRSFDKDLTRGFDGKTKPREPRKFIPTRVA